MATKESKVQDYYGNIYVPGMIPVKRTMIIMVLALDPPNCGCNHTNNNEYMGVFLGEEAYDG